MGADLARRHQQALHAVTLGWTSTSAGPPWSSPEDRTIVRLVARDDNLDASPYVSMGDHTIRSTPVSGPPGYEQFVRHHYSRLLGFAHAATGDRGHAEDVVQETLLLALHHWSSAQSGGLPYVRAIMRNVLIDRFRMVERRPSEATWNHDDAFARHDNVDSLEMLAALELLEGISPQQRIVLALRYIDDLSIEDTAAALGMTVGTVKSHTSRGLDTLRRRLRGTRSVHEPTDARSATP